MNVPEWSARSFAASGERLRRVTLDLASAEHRSLRRYSVEEDIPMAEVLRALVALWRRDPALRQRVEDALHGEVVFEEPLPD